MVQQSFIQLLNDHQNIIHKVCSLYMDNKDNREDLFQEISLQAYKSFTNFKGDSKFSTWLYRVALNTAITYFKKEKKKEQLNFQMALQPIECSNDNAIIEEQLNAMYKAIACLNKIDKALVMLYLEDYSYIEISDMLGISANNVAVKMNRLKVKLKEESVKHYQF